MINAAIYLKERGVKVMNEDILPLNRIPVGGVGTVRAVTAAGTMRGRFFDIGLIEDTRVECLQKSPSGDPAAYLIRGAVIALRNEDSSKILVEPA